MRLNVDFTALIQLANRFNSQKSQFVLEEKGFEFEPIDSRLNEGLDVDIKDVHTESGLLSYQGRQVLLYIKDHSYGSNFERALQDGSKGNKFHVAHCATLESMKNRNRYERYVAINNSKGWFPIEGSGGREGEAQLWVCQNCLKYLNYKSSSTEPSKRRANAAEFNLKEFFSTYSSVFKYMPMHSANEAVGYTDDWKEVSRQTRSQAGYKCESCLVNLSSQPNLCHAHHVNGVKHDNRPNNLQVLCADCHRKAHGGHMYVAYEEMQQITQLRKEQGLLDALTWDVVLERVDPALRGDLEQFKLGGFPIPILGHKVTVSSPENSKQKVCLEVAWPSMKEALTVKAQDVPNWRIHKCGDYFGV